MKPNLRSAWVVLLFAAGWSALAEELPRQPALRVLTYNIHHGEGTDGKLDLERLASVIADAKPDLVALQEVDRCTQRSGGVDQPARLGELTKLHVVFGKAMDYQGGAYGLAILSRWPVAESQTHSLPADAGVEPRAVLEARVPMGERGAEVRFLVTHLDSKRDPAQRRNQAERIRELFPVAKTNEPMLLAGDLNARPGSALLESLLADWTDGAAGENLLTSPAGVPRSKIDYILFRPAARWRVVENRVIEEKVASDHRPLLTVFEIAD